MAGPRRRGSSFSPPELRGTLGTLVRTTLAQAGVVRDVLERGAREGRARWDDVRADRQRRDLLAELGQRVLERVQDGALDELADDPDIAPIIDDLLAEAAPPPPRRAGPARGRAPARAGERAVARPGQGGGARGRDVGAGDDAADDADDADDGTVSARDWRPPPARAAGAVWRPPVDEELAPGSTAATLAATEAPPPPPRRGGIDFDDDGDLADYMHPDDVPPRR
ncbi:MAG: hypothetical protein KA297_05665 [Kofleriaceae bacterium]|nr:hypothetical protein [Kofleriaceae bacterium]